MHFKLYLSFTFVREDFPPVPVLVATSKMLDLPSTLIPGDIGDQENKRKYN